MISSVVLCVCHSTPREVELSQSTLSDCMSAHKITVSHLCSFFHKKKFSVMRPVSEERWERDVSTGVVRHSCKSECASQGTDLDAKDISGTRRPLKLRFSISPTKEINSTDAARSSCLKKV